MNNVLLNKILDKVPLKDLYDEIKDNPKMVYNLGIVIASKKDIFCKLIHAFMIEAIASGNKEITQFLKTAILNMDGNENISINDVIKRTAPKTTKSDPDPCGSGGGIRARSC